jgi:PAS domain S-box-containing protein
MLYINMDKKDSEKMYRQLVEAANSIILRMDVEGRVTFFNKFAQRFFGFKESEILGKNVIGTIVPVTDRAGRDLKEMINDIGRTPNKYVNNENENMLRTGERVWIAWTNRIIDGESGGKEALCVGNDITKIKEAEEVLKEMDKRKSAFVAHVAHEFKNPLAVIKESMALILSGTLGEVKPEQKEMLELGKGSIERLIRLVTDLLDISKIEAGKMKLKKEKIEIALLVNEVEKANFNELRRKGLSLKNNIPEDIGTVSADRDKLTEVIINLLSNAIKYTPSGGKIFVRLRGTKKDIRFEISDTGPGIAKEDFEKIFDKFERITAEREEGTGLGLSISRDIVELHSGKIWVESVPGKGSKFIFTLPRAAQNRGL